MLNQYYDVWNIEPISNFDKYQFIDQAKHCISWALLAANAHNAQPWSFELDEKEKTIIVHLNSERILTKTDKVNRQSITSIGCALYILEWVLNIYGVEFDITLNDKINIKENSKCALFKFKNVSKVHLTEECYAKFNIIKKRRINRGKYTGVGVSKIFLDEISLIGNDKIEPVFITDPTTILALSELQYMANRTVIGLPGFRGELAAHLFTSEEEVGIGMPGATFGLNDELTMEMREDMLRPGILNPHWSTGFAASDRDGIKSSRFIVVLVSSVDSPLSWMETGKIFQKISLIATEHQLSVAMSAGMVESRALNNLLRLRLGTLKKPLAVFRIGVPVTDYPHSPRLPIDEVCKIKGKA